MATSTATSTLPADGSTGANPIVFFDFTLGGAPLGRVKIQLYADRVPQAAENLRQFFTGEHRVGGRPQGYKGSRFHRIIPGFMIQGGDFISGDGTGSTSIFGGARSFADEKAGLEMRHDAAGVVSMANSGKDSNGCQFFILCAPAPHLNGKHVVVGKVVEGLDVVKMVEKVRLRGEAPAQDVVMAQCGEM